MSYVRLRSSWRDVTVMNVHAPTKNKSGDTKDGLCEELERVLD
jgi:hypothetical protein